jgi:raffinose/stachyose/melibiose transport system permease protein
MNAAGPRVTRVATLGLLVLFTVLPLLSMLSTALQPQGSLQVGGLSFPRHPHWHNFVDAWNAANMLTLMRSSLLIVVGVVPASVAIATLAGYGLARMRVPASRLLFGLFLLGLTLPVEAIISPLYYEMRSFGLLESRWAIILALIGIIMPFGVFWMRASFRGIPDEFGQAAQMDGASSWQVFRRVYLPLAGPGWSTLSILYFLWTWNQFILAIVLVTNPDSRTMAGALGAFQSQYNTNLVLLCAGALIIIAPSLLIFVVFQRQFVRALLAGGIK